MVENLAPGKPALCAALFLDFDNIYKSISREDPNLAKIFAKSPQRWLKWFEEGAHDSMAPEHPVYSRRILIRRCYITPEEHGYYRNYFTRAGFSVIDCPRLTTQGKNSADIHMVIDILDTLSHTTFFDEFMILSADADFTPVVLRLREHNRRSAILVNPQSVAIYKAACDIVVEQHAFLEEALGIAKVSGAAPGGGATVVSLVARAVAEELQHRQRIAAHELHRIFRRFPEFAHGDWFGFGSLNKLADEMCRVRPELASEGSRDVDWSFILDKEEIASEQRHAAAPPTSVPVAGYEAVRTKIFDSVREMLANAREPVHMAKAASLIINKIGRDDVIGSDWGGEGSFKALLSRANLHDIGIIHSQPGYLFNPKLWTAPSNQIADTTADDLSSVRPDMLEFLQRVHSLTGTPDLLPTEYAGLFTAISDASRTTYSSVREMYEPVQWMCEQKGLQISIREINFVISGLMQNEVDPTSSVNTSKSLGEAWCGCIVALCNSAQISLSDAENELLHEWIMGGIDKASTDTE